MELVAYIVVAVVAVVASALTLFSGFGLGTLLLPAFALFFPIPAAIAMTAVVHLLNNVFKLFLVGKHVDRRIAIRFGVPALVAAGLGALLMETLADVPPLATWSAFGTSGKIRLVALVISGLIILFAVLELLPFFNRVSIGDRWLPLGGAASGFFGGVSGHQGALRSAFLLRFKETLTKETFIATNVVIACLVDLARIPVYDWHAAFKRPGLLVTAVLAAFAGAFYGARRMKKVTMRTVRLIVSVLLILLGVLLGTGIIGR